MSVPAHANNSLPSHQVPVVHCDAEGYVQPLGAESRFQEHYVAKCASFFDPVEVLRVKPARRVVQDLPREVIEVALAPMWSRRKFSCRYNLAFDRFESEEYPVPADVVRDSRAPVLQIGGDSRHDGRPPVDVYKRLGTDAWQNEGQARVNRFPGYY